MNRWPALVVLALLIAGLVVLDISRDSDDGADALDRRVVNVGPEVSNATSSGSTWYCAAGFITPDAANDHVVLVSNPTDVAVSGTLTMYPSQIDTFGDPVAFERAVQSVNVEPYSVLTVSLAPVVAGLDEGLGNNTGAFVGALAEFSAPGVAVEHLIVSPRGQDSSPCATSSATSWWFASGTTTADVAYQLHLLNPFADDAVIDISFVTDEGVRAPSAFDSQLIPAQSHAVLRVSPVVPVWEQLTAQVTTRTGRVVVERVQVFENEEGPAGLSLAAGSNHLAEQWFFPAGGAVPGAGESYVVFNPGDDPAEVEFEVKPDSADRVGDVAPLSFTVGPGERWVVDVSSHDTHPVDVLARLDATGLVAAGEGYFASVRSFNGVPLVVERILTVPTDAGRGLTSSFGLDAASTDQMMAVPAIGEGREGKLAVLNPAGDTISRVDVLVGAAGAETVVAQVELSPRRRAVYDLDALLSDDAEWIRVRSTTGTMVEVIAATDAAMVSLRAIPTQGTTSIPDLLAFD